LIWLLLLSCFQSAPEPKPDVEPKPERAQARTDLPDVVLITIDTTRADRIGAYGYDKAHTEHIDALAARGRRYDQAWSTLPLTIPSHASLFTGKYPPSLGIRSNGSGKLEDAEETLAESMWAAGYATGASVGAFVTTSVWGFDQGFDSFRDDVPTARHFWRSERPGAEVVDDILEWKREQTGPRPLFAWVHLYDPHFPYHPPKRYYDEADGRPYDGELAYVDDQIGRLVGGFGDDALYLILSDHGEALGDHGEFTHGLFVYESTQRVPWIMAGPGIESSVVREPVSLVDVAPTLLSHLKLPPLTEAAGRVAPGDPPAPIYMESYQLMERFGIAPHVSVIDAELQLIDVPKPELYLAGKATDRPDDLARLQGLLGGFGFDKPENERRVAPDLELQLQALGYAEGGFAGDLEGDLPDPKDRDELIRKIQFAERLSLEDRKDELLALAEELVVEYPDILEFQHRRVNLLAGKGRHSDALDAVDSLILKDPDNPMIKHTRGTLLMGARRFEEAAIAFQEVARVMPYAPQIRGQAVSAMLEVSATKGIELGLAYLQDYADDYTVAGLVGVALVDQRQMKLGLEYLERGILADKPTRDVAFHMAAVATGRKDRPEARRLLVIELQNHPVHPEALITLVRLMGSDGEWKSQIDRIDPFLEGMGKGMKPKVLAPFWHLKAQAQYNLQDYAAARVTVDGGLKLDAENPDLLMLDANLLNQEGHREKAVARAEQAKAAKASRNQGK